MKVIFSREDDQEWSRTCDLPLAPHPGDLISIQAIEMDAKSTLLRVSETHWMITTLADRTMCYLNCELTMP